MSQLLLHKMNTVIVTSDWVLQKMQHIIGLAINSKTQIFMYPWEHNNKMGVSIHFEKHNKRYMKRNESSNSTINPEKWKMKNLPEEEKIPTELRISVVSSRDAGRKEKLKWNIHTVKDCMRYNVFSQSLADEWVYIYIYDWEVIYCLMLSYYSYRVLSDLQES